MSPHKLRNKSPDRYHRPGGHTGYKPNAPTPQESIQPDFLNKATGIDPEEEQAMEDRARSGAAEDSDNKSGLSSDQLQAAEQKGGAATPTDAEQDEGGSPSLYKGDGDGKTKGKGRFSPRKKLIAGGGAGLTVAVVMGIFGVIQGPFQFIHKAQLLQRFHFSRQDNFGDDRSGKFAAYMLMGKTAKGRLGVVSNVVADKWEKRLNNRSGLRSVYSPTTQRLIGYEILDETKAKEFLGDMDRDGIPRADSMQGVDLDGNPVTATNVVDLRDEQFRRRRSVTRTATRSTGINRLSSKLGSRLLIKRDGVNFHPMNFLRHKGDNYLERRKKIKDEQANELDSGNPNNGDSPNKSKRKKALTKLKTLANTAKGPALVAATVCGLQAFSDSIDDQNYENQLKLVRMGMRAVTIGNQVMSGKDFDLETLKILNEDMYDEETGTSWKEDPGIQYELGLEPTGKNYVADVKPGGKDKPLVFKAVDAIPTTYFGINVCGIFDLASNAPGIKQALDAMNAVTDGALKAVGIPTPDQLIQKAIDYFASGGVNELAAGAMRGGLENKGVRAGSNDQFVAFGGRELTAQEASATKVHSALEDHREFAQGNLFEKYFDIYDSRTVASKLIDQMPTTNRELISGLANIPTMLGSFGSTLFGSSSASAAETYDYDYGFPLYGYSLAEQNDPAFENPFENAAYIEEPGRLQKLNNDFGKKCFGMTISDEGDLVYDKAPDVTKIPDECKSTSNTELIKYRFYLADMITGHTLACYEGEEESCKQVGFGSGFTSASSSGGSTGLPSGDAQTLAKKLLELEGTKVSFTTPEAKQNIVDTAEGREAQIEPRCTNAGRTGAPLSNTLLGVLLKITEKHSIGIGYINNGCHSEGSAHYSGRGVDLGLIDGRAATGGDADRPFMQEITGILPDGSKMGEVQCSSIEIKPVNDVELFNDSCDHLHFQVPG